METHYAQPQSKVMNLPILKHFDSGQLTTGESNPLASFRKGEKGMFNIFKLVALAAVGYLSWVYVLPPLFQMLGQAIAIAGTIGLVVLLVMMAPVILKGMRRLTRAAHQAVIRHDPFGELEEQKEKMKANKKGFTISQGKIKNLRQTMQQEAANSEQNAKDLQHKISSARKKITKLKARQDELKATIEGKSSPEYTDNYAKLIKLGASVQRDMSQQEQQKNFVKKYGVRANTMQKLSNKLVLVGAQMDIKILDFDATIDILKREFQFAQTAREATDAAKNALMSTEGWEVEYAMDIVTSTIAQDIALTASNIQDIDSYTTLYNVDDDELYSKLDALADDIDAGKDIVPSAQAYNNPDYQMTNDDKLQGGKFGDIF